MTATIIIALWAGFCVGAILAGYRWRSTRRDSLKSQLPDAGSDQSRVGSVNFSHANSTTRGA